MLNASQLFGRAARAGAVVAVLAAGGQAMAGGGHGGGFGGGARCAPSGHWGGSSWCGRGGWGGWCGPRISVGFGFYGGCGYPCYSYGYPYGYYYPYTYTYAYAAAPYPDGAVVIPAATQTIAAAPASTVVAAPSMAMAASSVPSMQSVNPIQYGPPQPQKQAHPQDRDLGDAYMRMGDPENAVRVYSRYLGVWSTDATVNRNYGFALVERGDASRGFQAVVRGYQLDPDLVRRPLSPEDFGGKAGYQRVLDAAASTAASSPTSEGWLSVAVLQHASGQNEAALNALQRSRDAGLDKGMFDQMNRAFGGTPAPEQQQTPQTQPQGEVQPPTIQPQPAAQQAVKPQV